MADELPWLIGVAVLVVAALVTGAQVARRKGANRAGKRTGAEMCVPRPIEELRREHEDMKNEFAVREQHRQLLRTAFNSDRVAGSGNGSTYTDKSVEADFDKIWNNIGERLTVGSKIDCWSRDKGHTSLRFTVIEVSPMAIIISSPTASQVRRITKSDFARVHADWAGYCSGKISRSEMRDVSQNTSYIFGNLRWHEMIH